MGLVNFGSNIVASTATAIDVSVVAGENLSANNVVYIALNTSSGKTAGRAYKADADTRYESTNSFLVGFVPSAITSTAAGTCRIAGRLGGFTGLTEGAPYYVSSTAGAITSTKPTNGRLVGIAISTTEIVIHSYGNNSSIISGYNKGYVVGGVDGSVNYRSDGWSYQFSNDTCDASAMNYTYTRKESVGFSNGGTYGYVVGGESYGSSCDKITFSTNAVAAISGFAYGGGIMETTAINRAAVAGYTIGGNQAGVINYVLKLAFGSDTYSSLGSGPVAREYNGGLSAPTAGYSIAGDDGLGNLLATTEKITYATEAVAASNSISVARNVFACCSNNNTAGYVCGGQDSGGMIGSVEKLNYTTDTYSTIAGTVTAIGFQCGMSNGVTYGYVLGGFDGAARRTEVSKLNFSTDAVSATNALGEARSQTCALSAAGV